MTRVVVFLLLGTSAVAAPVPKASPAKNYFPLRVGHKWEYVNPDGSESHTEEVTAEEKKDGTVFYTVTRSRKKGSTSDTIFRVDADGVARVKSGPLAYDPPMLVVKAALTAGDRWTAKLRISDSAKEYELEVGKPEELKVPAGSFTAVPVTQMIANQPTKFSKYWYADGVGLVKSSPAGDSFVTELKAFTPAKEGKK